MKKKSLIFIVNGLGLGNSTRCESIIENLNLTKIEIDILTSGNGANYFRSKTYCNRLYELNALNYGKGKDGKLSVFSTLLSLPKQAKVFASNTQLLRSLIKKNKYDAIVIDSDYTLALVKGSLGVPVIALNNANIIIDECKKLDSLPGPIRMQYMIEKLDNFFHKMVPDVVLSPAINPKPSTKKIIQIAPFIRRGLSPKAINIIPTKLLVMLSGSTFGSTTEFLSQLVLPENMSVDVVGREGLSNDKIKYHGKIFDNKKLVNEADIVVINAGFSAVSEAVVLRKPCVVIPVENHAEQFINAKNIEEAGLGLVANSENVNSKIIEVINRYEYFVDNHRQFNCSTNGSLTAAQEIERLVELH